MPWPSQSARDANFKTLRRAFSPSESIPASSFRLLPTNHARKPPTRIRSAQTYTLQRLAASCLSFSQPHPLLSIAYSLLCQNRGWGRGVHTSAARNPRSRGSFFPKQERYLSVVTANAVLKRKRGLQLKRLPIHLGIGINEIVQRFPCCAGSSRMSRPTVNCTRLSSCAPKK